MKKVVYIATLGKNVSIGSYEADYDSDIGLYSVDSRTCPRDEMGKPRVGSVWGRTPQEVIAATHDWVSNSEKKIAESIRKTNRVSEALNEFIANVTRQGLVIDAAKRGA